MKKFNLLSIFTSGLLMLLAASCENKDIVFPDFDYSTVYFAYQHPVRTIVLGEDVYDTTLDNEHKFEIYATMGGVYANNKRVEIDFSVDNALCDRLYFDGDSPVMPMPSTYYALASDKIILDKKLLGSVQIQLADAFFADPNALTNTYVVPLKMTKVVNADSILSGKPKVDNPVQTRANDWDILPKDYVLYCVKFINQWHANYLRRGVDVITSGEGTTNSVRRQPAVEKDELVGIRTTSLTTVEYPVSVTNASGLKETCDLILSFNAEGKCSVSTTTAGFNASGNGVFVKKGEKNSWGNKDRDAIYLDYNISTTGMSYATKDTLVVRDRGVKAETFSPLYLVN